jgi:microcystin-dependent protein
LTFGIPSQFSADGSKFPNASGIIPGEALAALSSGEYLGLISLSGNQIQIYGHAVSPLWNATVPATMAAGNVITANAIIPIVGWSTFQSTYTSGQQGLSVGDITATSSTSCPSGTLLADGTAISRTTYGELFTKVGTTYGVGDGSTTFNLPNYSGIFLRGVGTQTIGGIVYTGALGTKQNDQMQGHRHRYYAGNTGGGSLNLSPYSGAILQNQDLTATNGPVMEAITDGTNGTPRLGTQNQPANIGVNYCIRTSSALIYGSFSGYYTNTQTDSLVVNRPTVPGISSGNIDTFSVSYGTTNSTTSCSASPCSYLDQIGTAVTSMTRSGVGAYSMNLARTYTKLKCNLSLNNAAGNIGLIYNGMSCSSCSGFAFNTYNNGPAASDSAGTLLCQGSY